MPVSDSDGKEPVGRRVELTLVEGEEENSASNYMRFDKLSGLFIDKRGLAGND